LFHAWEHWPSRSGRDALFARLVRTHSAVLEIALVLLPLFAHVLLGLWLARSPEGARPYVSPAFRKLQIATGGVAAAFVTFHVATVWLPRLREPNPIGAAYSAALEWTGTAPLLALHALGIAAVCTHFGQGMGLALPRLAPRWVAPRQGRLIGMALGLALWLIFLNELASYATYAPLL
jgi:succinate dehydrogenase/fumarate reductase cytochrome b subunit